MILITSHRPHASSPEYARTQTFAKRSWNIANFKKIIYVGPYEPELESQNTEFIYGDDFPTIQTLAKIAASHTEVCAIINADIAVRPGIRQVGLKVVHGMALCASSRRYHFDLDFPNLDTARLLDEDRGRDVFMAGQAVWRRVASAIPPHFRIGHQQWDAWMSDLFRDGYARRFYDFTRDRCVFHPIHGDRRMPHAGEIVEKRV